MSVRGPVRLTSWGRTASADCLVARPRWRHEALPVPPPGACLLPYGLGRSYGDVGLVPGGVAIRTDALDHLISFDAERGLVEAEAGVCLDDLLRVVVPRGWFLPVTPGTKRVTLGGALANDVHGKNHHKAGTFGRHVERFELLRSDGSRRDCSATENPELFAATIGGLGLTGLVTRLALRLSRIASTDLIVDTVRFGSVDEFLALTSRDRAHEHAVAWVDALSPRRLGRGVYFFGDHAEDGGLRVHGPARLAAPELPSGLLGRPAAAAFNTLYSLAKRPGRARVHYDPFFYPLDGLEGWNRLYGRRGFRQYQCLLPDPDPTGPLKELLAQASRAARGSFLCVLKRFGGLPSPGLLSFPAAGITACLDFPDDGARGEELFRRLDAVVRDARGRQYAAKDARMPPDAFLSSHPRWHEFVPHADPAFDSAMRRRAGAPRP